MTAETLPSPVPTRHSWRREMLDLLASMRFAIALLTVICIASAIGTVVKQGEPMVNYVDQFGPFWAETFGALGLYRIYSSVWFLVILAFLVISTSLCIARNTPKIVTDWRTHKEGIRERALLAFHHKAVGELAEPVTVVEGRVWQILQAQGWSIKKQVRQASAQGEAGVMIAARLGKANKVGYIAAHAAIVLVCLGGLFDGDLVVKVQAWAQGLQPFRGGTELVNSRLSERNPAYRAQMFVSEGQRTNASVINLDQGALVQPLPFDIELKKFVVDYYETGMPKRFASDIVIHDPREKEPKAFTVEVNRPVVYDGVTIFQSSFEDGGSLVQLRPLHLDHGGARSGPEVVGAKVGGAAGALPADWLPRDASPLQLEVTGLRVINVENLADAQSTGSEPESTDVRGVNLADLSKHLGSGAKPVGNKQLVNIGPSVTYKLRDAAGQAQEFQNFMAPMSLDGQVTFLLGVRSTPTEGFRYLRVPADEDMSLQGWLRFRQALNDQLLRAEAARRFAMMSAPEARPDMREQLVVSAQRALDLFAGVVELESDPTGPQASSAPKGGLMALSRFIEQVVPPEQREQTSGTLIRILNGALFELYNLSRTKAGLPVQSLDDPAVQSFMGRAVLSLSDAMLYPVPVVFMLDSFEQRQASVFQVTRTPGRNVVYLGCVLLIVGVFAMLYIRDRRLWVWLQQDPQGGGTRVRLALSSTRQTLDTDREFDRLRQTVLGEAPAEASAPAIKET